MPNVSNLLLVIVTRGKWLSLSLFALRPSLSPASIEQLRRGSQFNLAPTFFNKKNF